ncbi:MAG: 4'-phosphopantetheinyl transferase superfamily protein [Desulfovibrio sp.]|nr:4'-phosphopantetheinyl transferase superfamily protein [Desulfovibrio sp.]
MIASSLVTPLLQDEARVFALRLQGDPAWLIPFHNYYTETELVQAKRLMRKDAAEEFLAGHILIHLFLQKNQGLPCQDFAKGPFGKPYHAQSNCSFSLSHAHHLVLAAFTINTAIGIDIEKIEAEKESFLHFPFFHPQERKALLASSDQNAAAYRVWTRKEALVKALGRGFTLHPGLFQVSADLAPKNWLITVPPVSKGKEKKNADNHNSFPSDPHDWTCLDLHVNQGYQASIAIADKRRHITFFFLDRNALLHSFNPHPPIPRDNVPLGSGASHS